MGTADVLFAGSGAVSVAPYGTALPASTLDDLDPSFVDLGLMSVDGAQQTDVHGQQIEAEWGSQYPTLALPSASDTQIEFTPLEHTEPVLSLAHLGGTWSDVSDTERKYVPPIKSLPPILSVIVDGDDGER